MQGPLTDHHRRLFRCDILGAPHRAMCVYFRSSLFAVILTICLPPDGAIIVTRYVNQLRSEKSSRRETRMLARPGAFKLLQIRKTSDGAYSKLPDEYSTAPYDEEFNPYEYHPTDPYTPASGVTEDQKRDSPVLEGDMGVDSEIGTEPLVAKDPTVNQRHDV